MELARNYFVRCSRLIPPYLFQFCKVSFLNFCDIIYYPVQASITFLLPQLQWLFDFCFNYIYRLHRVYTVLCVYLKCSTHNANQL